MIKLLPSLLLVSVLTLSACSSLPDQRETPVVRFALRDDNIETWEEKNDGIAVHLNREGQRKLRALTRDHSGSEMEIYAGRVLLTSEKISQTLRGEYLYVDVNDDVMDEAIAQLPPAKKT